ncbi:hypothetical protein BKA58DRAFT_356149 [Alternaria rosae]|uniref:uncharacterized protein n=1 Tax=Alternaria rosae TaxID=1187941 RepID=UPI001E8D3598|nr:uncharacterized protein BKA58DRAFT_356149 [Alternaria rosae]KAH6879287.1 hypothetical protein BKA58DRAFT_356149 [Alternaria rosae]
MAPATVSTPQKRKASLAQASASKRTRSVSISVKVSHEATNHEGPSSPGLYIVPKNRQARLGGLPEELVLEIMEDVKENGGDKALSMLCLTDKRCKRIAEVVLYKIIDVDESESECVRAAAIARNALLPRHARYIGLDFYEKSVESVKRETFIKILANAHDVRYIRLTEWRDRPTKHDELAHTLGWLQTLNSAVARPVLGNVNRFAKLKGLTIIASNLSVDELSCVFRLPSLESLTLREVYQTTPFKNWSVPESSSSIRKLCLDDAMMDISALAQTLLAVKALHSFEYHRSTERWEPFAVEGNPLSIWPKHSWKLLGNAFRRHQHSLEAVYATDDSDKDILDLVYPDGREIDTLGSFRDFPRLKCCHVPVEAFLDPRTGESDLSLYLPPQVGKAGTKVAPKRPCCKCSF